MRYDLIVTSCNRFDLLDQTLTSFFKFADRAPSKVIIHEDSRLKVPNHISKHADSVIQGPSGQIAGIQKCHAQVNEDYFFHIEDDWCFTRSGFISESFKALEDPMCVNHWLRARTDTNGHPVEGDRLILNHKGAWHGFTFNPTLKRMADYPAKGYLAFCRDRKKPWDCESALGKHYMQKGMYATIAKESYVYHTGDRRHIRPK